MDKFSNVVLFMLTIVLALLSRHCGEVVYNFNLLDPWGEETSFPYVGGVVRMLCNVSVDDNTTKTYLVNKTDTANPNRKMDNDTFVLEHGLVGTKYNCYGNDKDDLNIGPLHCNPFSLIPKDENCKNYQWCLIEKDGHAVCKSRNLNMCFKFEPKSKFSSEYAAYHPHLNNVCYVDYRGSSAYDEKELCPAYGIGHIFGLTNDKTICGTLHSYDVKLNDKKVSQNTVNFAPISRKKWKITVVKNTETEFKCALSDEHNLILKAFTFLTNKSVEPKIQLMSLPAKLKLRCSAINQQKTMSFSVFVIEYDSNLTNYKAVIKKTPMNDGIILTCSCQVPKGFICGSKWDYPSRSSELMIVENKRKTYKTEEHQNNYELPIKPRPLTLKSWEHPTPVNYTCFLQVFAYDYPNSFDLLLVPLEREVIENTVTITREDFVTTTPKNGTSAELNEEKSKDQTNSKYESKITALIALISICLIVVIILVIAGILGYIKVGTISKKLHETDAKLNLSKAVTRETNRRKTSSLSTDQDNKRVSLLDEKKKSIPPKLPSRKIDNVESKYGGLKARRN